MTADAARAGRPSHALGRHARRFVLDELLGAGGFGAVHRAYDRQLGLEVALKIPHRFDPEGLLALKREFRVLAGLAHPHLLALHELFVGDASWFFTMDLVDGMDVLTFLAGRGLGQDDDRAAITGIVDGLAALHAHGLVHRDLKPSNAWIDRGGQAVLLDFGLTSPRAAPSEVIAGTPVYLAPELLEGGRPSPESDAYALGVVLYEALCGEKPFEGSALSILGRKMMESAPPSRDARGGAGDLTEMVDALLARDPSRRPSLAEVRAVLSRGAAPEVGAALAPSAGAASLIGRGAVLAELRAAYESSRGAVRIVRLVGPPGIGKSAILGALRDELARTHAPPIVLGGRCSEHETVPFGMLDEAMDALVSALRAESADDVVRASLPEIAWIAEAFPALELALPEGACPPSREHAAEPRERRRRVAHALRAILDRLAADRPIVLLLDDVQWADEDGAALLIDALACAGTRGLLLVLAQRDGEGGEALARLASSFEVTDITVPPLAPDDARALVRRIAGAGRAEEVAIAAGGSPFLLEALAHADSASVGLWGSDGAKDLARRAIFARIDALPPAARALLETAAIAGHPIALDTARAAIADDGALGDALSADDLASGLRVDVGAVRRLESMRLVRARSKRRGTLELEPYHDRVRELVVASLPEARRRASHGALARALESKGERDVLRLCMHYREAAELARAAALAEVGARDAQEHLAFARAAELYRFALAHREPDDRSRELRMLLGEALAAAGHASEAADAFLAALAGTSDPDARLDLRRRAAEQLLRGGSFRRGVALLDEVLIEAGVPVRRSPARALFSLVRTRAKLVRLATKERALPDPRSLDPVELRRIDACVSGAMGLSVVDSLRSADLMNEALARALEHGDGRRLAICTIWQTAFAANEGGPGEPRTRALLSRGITLADRHGGPYERGCVQAASALTEFHLGNFGKALAHTLDGERIFLEETRGTTKESGTMQIFSLASQAMLGDVAGIARRVDSLLHDAQARGDLYASTNYLQGLPMLRWLARDQPERAHADLDRAMRGFDASGYAVQHFMDLLGRVLVLLYEGRAKDARARFEADRSRLARSLLSRTQWTRVHTGLLDVWTALALAAEERGIARQRLLMIARVRTLRLAREDRPWTAAIAEAMGATIDATLGSRSRADARWKAVLPQLEATELGLYAGLAHVALGSDRGRAWAEENGIARPERLACAIFPGVSRSS